jgi:hypothetical protein
MKRICLLSLVIMATAFLDVFAAPIQSYEGLTSAMRAGNRFVILLDLQQCSGNSDMPMGYLTPTMMLLMPASDTNLERVMTSFLHFTDHLGYPIYEYVTCTFNSDDTVVVRMTFYDPQNFKPMGAIQPIDCSIGKGIEIYSGD